MLDLPIKKNATPEKKRIKKEGSCGKGQSSQEASQQQTDPWAILLVGQVWVLVSEPGFVKVLGDLGRQIKFILRLRPRSNIV